MSNDPTRDFARHMRKSRGPTAGEQVAALALVIGLMIPFALWNGFVLTKLWAWFLVPLGAPKITLALAIGISLTVTFLTNRASKQEPDEGYMTRALSYAITEPAFALLIGYVVHLFV